MINNENFGDWEEQSKVQCDSAFLYRPAYNFIAHLAIIRPTSSDRVLLFEYSNSRNSLVGFFVHVNGYFHGGFIGPSRFSCVSIGSQPKPSTTKSLKLKIL